LGHSAEFSGYAVQNIFSGVYFGSGHARPRYLTPFLSQARVFVDERKARRVAHQLSRRHGVTFVARIVAAHSDQIV
jgi:hypothetical protein